MARARHARVSVRNGPFRTIPDSLCSPQGFEMSAARPAPHSRFSTVENRVTSIPRQHMSVRPETQGKHSACVVAPSLPHTLADCAPPRPQPHHRFSIAENRPRRPPEPTCVQASVTGCPRSQNCPRPRAIAPPHARRLCLAAGTVPSPFLDSRKSAASTARANKCASILVTGYPKDAKLPAPSRHRSPTLSQTVRGSRSSCW